MRDALLSIHQHLLMTTTQHTTTTTMTTKMQFQVNDKATFHVYTDSYAGYIVKTSKSGTTVWFCRADAKLLGNSGKADQRWEIANQPRDERPTCFTLRTLRNGKKVWKMKGQGTYSPGLSLSSGHRHHYDFNF